MAKMVPIGAKQSMLEEPSRGSKHTTYLPCKQKVEWSWQHISYHFGSNLNQPTNQPALEKENQEKFCKQ